MGTCWSSQKKGVNYKPNFVSVRGRTMIISLGRRLPGISCNLPGGFGRAALKRLPIWSCTRWGLPCPPCRHGGGELLPRHFNLACERLRAPSAVSFLRHFPPVSRSSRYEPPRPSVFGLSSPAHAGAIMHSPPISYTGSPMALGCGQPFFRSMPWLASWSARAFCARGTWAIDQVSNRASCSRTWRKSGWSASFLTLYCP